MVRWLLLFVVLAASCLPDSAVAGHPPASQRSMRVVAHQQPALEKSLSARGFRWGAHLFVRIFKQERSLEVWLYAQKRFKLYKTYPICTYGGRGLGPKTRQGDGRAPEGFYYVSPEQMNPFSRYHLAFNLGYPNAYDRRHGRTGSALMVHGDCVSIGCFAMTDAAMEEIYTLADAAFKNRQPFFRVHIFPFRMTENNIQKHRFSPWVDFWRNLRVGYDWFGDHHRLPPNVLVEGGRYRFEAALEDGPDPR